MKNSFLLIIMSLSMLVVPVSSAQNEDIGKFIDAVVYTSVLSYQADLSLNDAREVVCNAIMESFPYAEDGAYVVAVLIVDRSYYLASCGYTAARVRTQIYLELAQLTAR